MPSTTVKPQSSFGKISIKLSDAKQLLVSVKKKPTNAGVMKIADSSVEKLRRKLMELQSELDTLRPREVPKVILPELHDRQSGRIDAAKVAEFMGVPLKQLAEGLGLNYKAVHRNPSASGFQEALRPVKRSLELLHEFFGPPEAIRIWLNTPHPDLAGATALDTILAGKADAVALVLENAWNGVPV